MPELVDLEPARQQEIIDLEKAQEGKDYFFLLGLPPGAPIEDVKRAFVDFALKYHPDRYSGLNLGSFRARIERIFRRVSEVMARSKAAIAKGDFEQAYAALNQLVNLDPKNREAGTMLADVRKKHDEQRAKTEMQRGIDLENQQDLPKALECYRKASAMDTRNAEAAYRAAKTAKTLGLEWNEIRVHAQRAVDVAPDTVAYRLL